MDDSATRLSVENPTEEQNQRYHTEALARAHHSLDKLVGQGNYFALLIDRSDRDAMEMTGKLSDSSMLKMALALLEELVDNGNSECAIAASICQAIGNAWEAQTTAEKIRQMDSQATAPSTESKN